MSFWYKYYENLLTIKDQEEALKDSEWSYWFSLKNIPGSDFKALQAKACEDSKCAYKFAENVSGADIKYCQQYACKNPYDAYLFALYVPGADIQYCQEHACKEPDWAFCFARDIPGADIKYCFKYVFPEEKYGPDKWKKEYNKYIMRKACE